MTILSPQHMTIPTNTVRDRKFIHTFIKTKHQYQVLSSFSTSMHHSVMILLPWPLYSTIPCISPPSATKPHLNGSCLIAAGLPTDIVGSENFQTFSTRQTQHLGDWWGELTTTTKPLPTHPITLRLMRRANNYNQTSSHTLHHMAIDEASQQLQPNLFPHTPSHGDWWGELTTTTKPLPTHPITLRLMRRANNYNQTSSHTLHHMAIDEAN